MIFSECSPFPSWSEWLNILMLGKEAVYSIVLVPMLCLQDFEKISRSQPTQCLQAGMIAAVLQYIDLFSASIQRVAVPAVANACKKVPPDCSQFVVDSVSTLCKLLQYEDKMVNVHGSR